MLDLLRPRPGLSSKAVLQLTPELAQDLSEFDAVVFIDADVGANAVEIEPCGESRSHPALTHRTEPSSIVVLARQLFAFQGQAFLCRIPAEDFSSGVGLSERAEDAAAEAARRLEDLVSCGGHILPVSSGRKHKGA